MSVYGVKGLSPWRHNCAKHILMATCSYCKGFRIDNYKISPWFDANISNNEKYYEKSNFFQENADYMALSILQQILF